VVKSFRVADMTLGCISYCGITAAGGHTAIKPFATAPATLAMFTAIRRASSFVSSLAVPANLLAHASNRCVDAFLSFFGQYSFRPLLAGFRIIAPLLQGSA
jgi:hypothetical protein